MTTAQPNLQKANVRSAALRPPRWSLDQRGSQADLHLTGDWISSETGVRSADEARRIVHDARGLALRLDGASLGRWDSALIAFLKMIRDAVERNPTTLVQLDDSGLPDAAHRLLALATAAGPTPVARAETSPRSVATQVGEAALKTWSETVVVTALVGQTALRTVAAFAHRTHTRGIDVLQLMLEAGAGALVIVAIVNGLIGAILAFVGAVQLRRFGAEIYVADLVGIAMVREMAAVMTAIVMAGRTGGAYAAHLATMQGNEEIDALKAFGIPVYDFLVLPRITALVTMMPLLYLYGCAVGLLGGYVVSIATLDLASSGFLVELRAGVAGKQFAIGLVKSVAFGALVALAGCHIGLRAGRSAADVGRAATSAVVAGIIGVIALDAIFAACTNALGI